MCEFLQAKFDRRVEIRANEKDGLMRLIISPPPLSLSLSLTFSHLHTFTFAYSIFHPLPRFLSYFHSPFSRLPSFSLSLFSHADIHSYLVRILDRHLIYGDTYIQKEYQKNKYICKYIYVYIYRCGNYFFLFIHSSLLSVRKVRRRLIHDHLFFFLPIHFSDD